jgi:mono/diheme cytochrome c family protein
MILSMSRTSATVLLLCLGAAVVAQAQMGSRQGHGGMRHGSESVSMLRHHFVHAHGIDAEYAGKTSPLAPTPEDLARGRSLYERDCASCHGPAGLGDGAAGAALTPPPSNIASASKRHIATDTYLFWTIAEGGAPVGSAMPPFKAALSESDVWQIIAYLRRL